MIASFARKKPYNPQLLPEFGSLQMSEHDTTEEENLRIVKSAIEAHNAHDVSHAVAYEAESIVHYSPAHPKGVKGRESVISSMTADFVAFANIQFKVDRIIGEGDSVSVFGVLTGTNTGPFLTEKSRTVKASNKQIQIPQAYFYRLNGGKIVETHEFWDTRRLMAQLGFLRKNVFRAFFIVALGLILVVVNALIFYRSDVLLQLPGLLVGSLEIALGTRWLGKSLLVLSRTG